MLETRKIVRGLLTRFLPACGTVLFGVFLYSSHRASGEWLWSLVRSAGTVTIAATAGAGIVLALFRRRMDPDTPIDSRPGVVAGMLTPIVLFIVVALAYPVVPLGVSSLSLSVRRVAMSAIAGALVTFGIFFPWLSHAKPRGRARAGALRDETRELAEPFDVISKAKPRVETRKR